MAYHALDENALLDYLRGRPALAEHLPRGAALSVREVGDGNLNLLSVVSNRAEPAQAVIVNHGDLPSGGGRILAAHQGAQALRVPGHG